MKPFNLSQHLTRSEIHAADYLTMDAADSTVGFQALVDAINATPWGADVYIPAGIISLSTSVFTFTKPVTLRGGGVVQSQIHLWGHAQLRFDYNRSTVFDALPMNQSLKICDLSVLVDGIHTSEPIYIDFSPHIEIDAPLNQMVVIENVYVGGRTSTSGFNTAIKMVDVGWAKLRNVALVGDYGNGGAYASQFGIVTQGTGGSYSFDQVRGYFLTHFIYMDGAQEGIVISDSECVACHRGVTYLDSTAGLQPLVNILTTHLNCEEYCVSFTGVSQFTIGGGCLFYGQGTKGTSPTWTAVDITPSTASGGSDTIATAGRISDVTIVGDGAFGADKCGIRVRGSGPVIEKYLISGCQFQGMDWGVQIDAGVNTVMMSNTNSFINVVTPFADAGAGNYREPRTVSRAPVGTTDALGQMTFPFGTDYAFTAPPTVTICGGDGGSETYNVVFSSVTATEFKVQASTGAGVALGSGMNRRISFVAVGY